MIAGRIICASLTVGDGDTVKWDGQNMRLLGEGVPLSPGIDTAQTYAKWMKERKPALVTNERPEELLAERGLEVMFSGMDPHMQRNERVVSRRLP